MIKCLNKRISSLFIWWYFSLNHPMKVRTWNLVWDLMGKPRFTVPYCNGAEISLDIHDLVQKKIALEGLYEPEVWAALAIHAAGDEILWDIGGHVGGVSIRAALHPAVRTVHTFEPHPETYEALKTNVDLNPELSIEAHNTALSDQYEVRRLHSGPSINSGQSSMGASFGGRSFQVQCDTIDRLIREEGLRAPTLIKMDVEGWELHVLKGARWLFERRPPKAVVFEDEAPLTDDRELPESATIAFLQKHGYSVTRLVREQNPDHETENYLAVYSS
jgi:FkbM family methyltransferase